MKLEVACHRPAALLDGDTIGMDTTTIIPRPLAWGLGGDDSLEMTVPSSARVTGASTDMESGRDARGRKSGQ